MITALAFAFLAIALLNLLTAPRLARPPRVTRLPKLSLLIPARNEAENLVRSLPPLFSALEEGWELLVYDDQSTDDTAEVARACGARVITGTPRPPDWLGKNWACAQLARAATGEVLLFVDADVVADPRAPRATAAFLTQVHAFSAWTKLVPRGWAARSVVPFVCNLPPLCTLPLALVSRVRAPSVSAANGQWLAFRRETYEAIGGHAAVCDSTLEDVALGRLVKRAGFRLIVAYGANWLRARGYENFAELREGYGRNLYPLAGGRWWSALTIGLLGIAGWILPWFSDSRWVFGASLGMRVVESLIYGADAVAVVLHVPGALLTLGLLAESARQHARCRVRWRGRAVTSDAKRSGRSTACTPAHPS